MSVKKQYVVEGITCAGCVNSVEKALKSVEGVEQVNVNLATGKAIVEHPESLEFERIEKAINDAGYTVKKTENGRSNAHEFNVKGMHCAGCVNAVEKTIRNIGGVKEVSVNLANGKAFVDFDENETGIQKLIDAVKDAGYTLEPSGKKKRE